MKENYKELNKYQTIETSIIFENIYLIKLNRPKKFNALNKQVIFQIEESLLFKKSYFKLL